LNIHGLAHTGIWAGRLTDWTVEDVRIAANGLAGWDGDIDGSDSNSGTLTFRRLTVEWNGCAESYPDKQVNNCWGQSAGGYGDGFGQGGLTGGHWIIEDSVFRYNTQDGIDMLYVRQGNSQIEIRRTQSYGNAGDQIKVNGSARIENSLMVSNCGFFNGKSFTYDVGDCRAGGSALVFSMRRGSKVSVVNSTLAGQGDCLLIVECDTEAFPAYNGSEAPIIQNNIFRGYQEFGSDDTTCDVWFDRDNFYQTQEDYNVIHPDTKLGEFQHGSHDIFQDPLFVNANLETFDGHLQSGSPAIDSGLPVGGIGGLVPTDDLGKTTRPQGSGVDRGAYEFGGSACSYSISPTSATLGPGAGSGSVAVTAGPNCPWTAATNAGSWDWIGISSGSTGVGNGTVNYFVLSNNSGSTRTGTLAIAGQTFTITQQAQQGSCTYSISPASATLGPGAGSGSVAVTAGPNCPWTAATNAGSWDWIGISSGSTGAGNGTVNYLVLPNNSGGTRTGTLAIAGQTFTITQQAQQGSCTYSISPTSATLGPGAGSGSVAVTAGPNCPWTAATNAGSWDWIGISSGSTGTGNGTVNYLVLSNNSGNTRTGTLTIAGRTFTVSQSGGGTPADNPNKPNQVVRLIFIHHSTGENWLGDDNGGLGTALRDNNYYVSDTNYGWGPLWIWEGTSSPIGDNTDAGHWWVWFRGPGSTTYLNALYNEGGQNSSYSRFSTGPSGENEVIMFKSCFPNSDLEGNPNDPVPSIDNNPLRGEGSGSENHTVANVKGIYKDLLEYFRTRQDKLFIVITAPPLAAYDTTSGHAANARAFNNWLINEWLTGYPYKNVAVFDFYNVLTSNGGNADTNDIGLATGNHHRWWNGTVQHIQTSNSNTAAYPTGDSHPGQAGNLKATAEYVKLLNVFYHRWKGQASIGTGESD
jgi:hypothetical protein